MFQSNRFNLARLRETLNRVLNVLLTPRAVYHDALDRHRARAMLALLLSLAALSFIGPYALTITSPRLFSLRSLTQPILLVILTNLSLYGLVHLGRLRIASFSLVTALILLTTSQMVPYGPNHPGVLGFALPVIAATLLLGPVWGLASTALAAAGLALITFNYWVLAPATRIGEQLGEQFQINPIALDLILNAVTLSTILLASLSVIASLLARSLYRLATTAARRADQLEAAIDITNLAAGAPTVNSLLASAVTRIRDTYGFYHAQVFLIDQEGKNARLEASTGRAGAALLARGHTLAVGSRSVIGQTTYRAEPVTINDVRNDPTHRPNELLPDTRAELALPLIVGDRVIGALDVQSTRVNAFLADDVSALQSVANQLAGYIEKVRLVSELQARAAEQQTLIDETQTNLRQIDDLNRRLTREGWSDYLQSQRARGALGYTMQGPSIQSETDWTAPMRQAFQAEQSVVIRQDQQAQIAAVPLRIRGEVIGVLEIERDGSRPWTDSELELAETLVDRLALAVENARLYEQATVAVDRERAVNKIAQEVQEARTIDEILQSALSELGTLLGASRGVVQIQPKSEAAT